MPEFYGGTGELELYQEPYGGVYFDGSFNVFVTDMVASARGASRPGVNAGVDWFVFYRDHSASAVGRSVEGVIDVRIPGDNRLTKALTNYGKFRLLDLFFRDQTEPTLFRLVLCTDNVDHGYRPSQDTINISELKQIPSGNGYPSGGVPVYRNTTSWPICASNNSLDEAVIQLQTALYTAVSGPIPKAGAPIYYAVLVDNSGNVIGYFDLSVDGLVIPDGITLALRNLKIKLV